MDGLRIGLIAVITITSIHHCCISAGISSATSTNSAHLSTSGLVLQKGGSKPILVPSSWGRTHCTQDFAGKFSCVDIGNCGSGKLECRGGTLTCVAAGYIITLCSSADSRHSTAWKSESNCVVFSPKREWLQALRILQQVPMRSSNAIKSPSFTTLREVSIEPKLNRASRTLKTLRNVPNSPEPDIPIKTP